MKTDDDATGHGDPATPAAPAPRRALVLGAAAGALRFLPVAGAALATAPAARARVTGRPARIAWPASGPITQWPPFAVFVEAMR
jgi:hypothetical protein